MTLRIGIDAGGTLTKIAAQRNDGEFRFLKFPSTDTERIVAWLAAEAPGAALAFTGGKAGQLRSLAGKHMASDRSPAGETAIAVPEFEATCAGARWLLERQGRRPGAFLLTNVGTGTSIHHITPDGHERVGGTGVGGGTILGLAALLSGKGGSGTGLGTAASLDYTDLVAMAAQGDRTRVDLKVSHIYAGATPPIPGELTASNFGHVVHQTEPIRLSDALASVIGLVGETVTTVSVHAARERGTAEVVYIGSTFRGNALLEGIVNRYTRLRGAEPYVLPDGEYSGAVGALLAL
jgi:type II pantothenate kinase